MLYLSCLFALLFHPVFHSGMSLAHVLLLTAVSVASQPAPADLEKNGLQPTVFGKEDFPHGTRLCVVWWLEFWKGLIKHTHSDHF